MEDQTPDRYSSCQSFSSRCSARAAGSRAPNPASAAGSGVLEGRSWIHTSQPLEAQGTVDVAGIGLPRVGDVDDLHPPTGNRPLPLVDRGPGQASRRCPSRMPTGTSAATHRQAVAGGQRAGLDGPVRGTPVLPGPSGTGTYPRALSRSRMSLAQSKAQVSRIRRPPGAITGHARLSGLGPTSPAEGCVRTAVPHRRVGCVLRGRGNVALDLHRQRFLSSFRRHHGRVPGPNDAKGDPGLQARHRHPERAPSTSWTPNARQCICGSAPGPGQR